MSDPITVVDSDGIARIGWLPGGRVSREVELAGQAHDRLTGAWMGYISARRRLERMRSQLRPFEIARFEKQIAQMKQNLEIAQAEVEQLKAEEET